MLGLSFEKLILIILVAALVVGPQRLPLYAEKLAQLIRAIHELTDTAKKRATAELGPDFDPSEWKKLDPRHYDPQRIVRETLANVPPSEVPPIHVEQIVPIDEADAISSDQTIAPPPTAKGSWQEALLARVATPTPRTPTQAVATGTPSSKTCLDSATYNDS